MKFTTSLVGSIVTYPRNLNSAIKVSTMQFTLQQTWLLSSINTHIQIHQDLDKRWILLGLLSDTSPVLHNVLDKEVISFSLCRIGRVGLVQQILDANKNLFHCNCRSPSTIFVEDRQADSSRGVDIRVEETRGKFTLWWFARVVFGELDCKWVVTPIPVSPSFTRDSALPYHQINRTIRECLWLSNETMGVILPPGFSFLGETATSNSSRHLSLSLSLSLSVFLSPSFVDENNATG
jgi:hypothetical protein